MANKLSNYLRTYRKRAGLTQDEMAYLLGCRSGAKVSRYEHFTRQPSLKTVFAYQVVFHASSRELFPGEVQKVEERVKMQARLMIRKYEDMKPDPKIEQKIRFLKEISGQSAGTRIGYER